MIIGTVEPTIPHPLRVVSRIKDMNLTVGQMTMKILLEVKIAVGPNAVDETILSVREAMRVADPLLAIGTWHADAGLVRTRKLGIPIALVIRLSAYAILGSSCSCLGMLIDKIDGGGFQGLPRVGGNISEESQTLLQGQLKVRFRFSTLRSHNSTFSCTVHWRC